MSEERVQTELQAVKNDIAATRRAIAAKEQAIQAAESKEDSLFLKQQLTQLTTQLTYMFEERKRLFDLLYPPPPQVPAPAPPQQPAETGYVTAYLSPRKLEFVWIKLYGDNFPPGMKTGLKNIAIKCSGIKWSVQRTSARMVEQKAQHSVIFTAWGELSTLQTLHKNITSYAKDIECAASSVFIIPDLSYQLDNAECDIIPTRGGTLKSDGSGKGQQEQATSSEPAPSKRETKNADTRSTIQKMVLTAEQHQTLTDTIDNLHELSDQASELAKSIASPETSSRFSHDFTDTLRRELPPKKFIKIEGGFHATFGVAPTRELTPIRDIAWDVQYYFYPDMSIENIKGQLQAFVLDRAVSLDEAAINVTRVVIKS